MTDSEIIREIEKWTGLKTGSLAKEVGLNSAQTFYDIHKGKHGISREVSRKILNTFPEIDRHWLLTGEGEMLKKNNANVVRIESSETLLKQKINENNLIPLFELATMKALNGTFVGKHQHPIDYIYIPNLSSCDGAVSVRGNSMAPYICSGDIILFKQIKNIPEGVYFGEIYLISVSLDGDEYVAVNQVKQSAQEDQMTLTSFNQDFNPKDIPISAIKAMALVKAGIKYISML